MDGYKLLNQTAALVAQSQKRRYLGKAAPRRKAKRKSKDKKAAYGMPNSPIASA